MVDGLSDCMYSTRIRLAWTLHCWPCKETFFVLETLSLERSAPLHSQCAKLENPYSRFCIIIHAINSEGITQPACIHNWFACSLISLSLIRHPCQNSNWSRGLFHIEFFLCMIKVSPLACNCFPCTNSICVFHSHAHVYVHVYMYAGVGVC